MPTIECMLRFGGILTLALTAGVATASPPEDVITEPPGPPSVAPSEAVELESEAAVGVVEAGPPVGCPVR